VKASARGAWTAEVRRIYEPAGERRARAEEQLARSAFPNVKVTAIEVSDPHDIEKPFVTRIAASATGFASPSGAGLHFSPFGQRQSYVEAYAQLSQRSLPERLPAPLQSSIVTELELPSGWSATLPEGVHESGPQGSYEISYAREPGKVVSRLSLTLNGGLLRALC